MRAANAMGWSAAWLVALLATLATAVPAVAGPFTRLQVLVPGESPAPGTSTGRTGAPQAQTAGVPFTITVRACDTDWNTVTTVTDAIQVLATDASATLPAPAQLEAGERRFTVTLNAGGTFTLYAHDGTDGTIPDGASSAVRALVIQGFQFSRITQKNQYAGVSMPISVTAVDAAGNTVSGYSGTVRLQEMTSYGVGRVSPATVTLSGGVWAGNVTMYRADETSINRGNVNLYADLENAPAKNGTSDPFTVHPGPYARAQVVVPGQSPAPGSVSGVTGAPASQAAGRAFTASVFATDAYWNPVPAGTSLRLTSSDPAFSPVTVALTAGAGTAGVTLRTVGTQTLTAADPGNGAIAAMTSAGIAVLPSAADHFGFGGLPATTTAGAAVAVTVRALDANGNLVPDYAGEAILSANTGAGSIAPELVTFANGTWSGNVVFKGAGGAVRLTCSDFSSPPHTGTSASLVVQPGPFVGLQVLLPGETAQGGTADGKSGAPQPVAAGAPYTVTVRAVDAWWNLVPGVDDIVRLGSTDAFALLPADTTLSNGQVLVPARFHRAGANRVWAGDSSTAGIRPDTSSAFTVSGGPFAKVLVLAPGESTAPGTATGRTGTATDQSIHYAFNVTVLATDAWWNPVGGVSDVVRVTSGDPLAQLPPDAPLADGRAELPVRLATGGFQQIGVTDVSRPSIPGSTTQVRAISSGFHLEAAVSPTTVKAGAPFTLLVKITNDAGSVIQEINSFVTVEVQRASDRGAGRGTLLTTQFQLLQGQRAVSETYTFSEDIVLVVRDDAGNAPGVTGVLQVTPGDPARVALTSDPAWVGGNKHATLRARLEDEFGNGIPGRAATFAVVSGTGVATGIDSLTGPDGVATADFLSPRQPERDLVRASVAGLAGDLWLETAFVDPTAAGGTVTNYPNPFHPPVEGTTLAWKLDDHATVKLRIFTLGGELVREETFARGGTGGAAGLNEWVWDGRNGGGRVVASGGYVALVEAQGVGQTLHVMRRRIAVVR